ncbi:MAG: hypothetical protein ABSG64_05850 [Solirubrobacteraceae bacterium]
MQSATPTAAKARPDRLARLRAVPVATWAKIAFALMCVAALVGFLIFPTYPIYDSEYYLLWGREILHLQAPSFQVYDAPTEHPLAVAFGTVLALLGGAALRVEILCAIGSFLILAAGLYRLSRTAFTPVVGAAAVFLLCTRFDLAYLAIRGYVDITYMALVVWAAALEIERPRRGTPVFVLLAGAELIRPDAWLLAGLYWLWCAPKADWPTRIRWAAIVASGPVIWSGLDLLVTGDPLYSLHATNNLAVSLSRTLALGSVPSHTVIYLELLVKVPVFAGGIAGVLLALWFVPRRMWASFVVLVSGVATFIVIAAAGLSVIDRYLLVPAAMLIIFCAFALTGWTMLERGLARRIWASGAALLAAYGVASAAANVSLTSIVTELGFRDDSHSSLVAILDAPAVKQALRCGPLSVPNHKLIPDASWLLDRGPGGVVARSEADHDPQLAARIRYGVALYPLGLAVSRYALVSTADNPLDQVPLRGFKRVAYTEYYAAYASCPA